MSQLADKIFLARHTSMTSIAIERQPLRLGHKAARRTLADT